MGGGILVLDSRPIERIAERERAVFTRTGHACALPGWRYACGGGWTRVPVANQRWLACYRHPRCFVGSVADTAADPPPAGAGR